MGSLNGRIRITEQGEALSFKYGLPQVAERNLDSVVAAVLERTLEEDDAGGFPGAQARVGRGGRRAGRDRDRRLPRASSTRTPTSSPTSSQASPIRELGLLTIGSRPSRRPGGDGDGADDVRVEDLRAIPWVFAWTQNRHLLPSWYGVGTALEEFMTRYRTGRDVLREMYAHWPWWRAIVDTCHMTVGKADMRVAGLYARLVDDEALRDRMLGPRHRRVPAHGGGPAGRGRPRAAARRQALPADLDPPAQPLRRPAARDPGAPAARVPRRARPGRRAPRSQHPLLLTISGIAAGLRNTG